jgi:glycosyltransferase involved in cell wall biosynthesis
MSGLTDENDRPRTVLLIESAAAMGGVQYSTLYLVRQMDRARWKPIVMCPEEGDLTTACRDAGVDTRVLQQRRLRSTSVRIGDFRVPNAAAWGWNAASIRANARALAGRLKDIAPDLVITKGMSAHFYGGLAARQLKLPCVWHVQDFISERNLGLYRRAFGVAARWLPARIIADGHTIKKQLPRSLHNRVTVIHNGVDTSNFRPGYDGAAVRLEFGIQQDQIVVGHVGRMTPWKGQHHLIEAFARIAQANPKAVLLMVGSPVFDNDAYQRRLFGLANEFNLQDRVKFAGYRHDMARVLSAMDLLAFTSIEKDTSPLTLLSAMACGLPIVAFDIAGVRELMASDRQFRLTPVKDITALAEEISVLLSDDTLRKELGQLAREQALKEFDLEKCTARIEQLFHEVLSDAGASTSGQLAPAAGSQLRNCA